MQYSIQYTSCALCVDTQRKLDVQGSKAREAVSIKEMYLRTKRGTIINWSLGYP